MNMLCLILFILNIFKNTYIGGELTTITTDQFTMIVIIITRNIWKIILKIKNLEILPIKISILNLKSTLMIQRIQNT
jgi:hypothetical protein